MLSNAHSFERLIEQTGNQEQIFHSEYIMLKYKTQSRPDERKKKENKKDEQINTLHGT